MFQGIKNFFTKNSKTGSVVHVGTNGANWSKKNYKAFAEEGFNKNVIAFQAIEKTAKAVAGIPIIAKKKNGDILSEHAFLTLLKNPNPMQSKSEFFEAVVGYYRISGNSYIERTIVRGTPVELYAIRPDRTTIKPGASGMPLKYVYKVGQAETEWLVDQINGESDMRHLKTFNPIDDWYGMSPIEAGAYGIDQHNESMTHIQSLLQNGAAPSGALEVEGTLSEEEYNRLKAEINEKYSGAKNAGRPMLNEGGIKWVQMGFSPTDMKILATKDSSARDISLALGVPPLLLSIPGDATYSNYKEARLAFYEETVIPLANYIAQELNAWLSPLFDGVTVEFDINKIPAIIDKKFDLWAMADASDDLTINEKRAIKGYPPLKEGGDTVYISTGSIPISFDLADNGGEA